MDKFNQLKKIQQEENVNPNNSYKLVFYSMEIVHELGELLCSFNVPDNGMTRMDIWQKYELVLSIEIS